MGSPWVQELEIWFEPCALGESRCVFGPHPSILVERGWITVPTAGHLGLNEVMGGEGTASHAGHTLVTCGCHFDARAGSVGAGSELGCCLSLRRYAGSTWGRFHRVYPQAAVSAGPGKLCKYLSIPVCSF